MVKSTLPPGDKKSGKSDDEQPRNWTHQVQGGKYIKQLQKFVQTLRQEDSQTAHGNQKLFLDDVFITYLPTRKICKSTLSDFNALVDPARLQPLIEALQKALQQNQFHATTEKGGLSELLKKTIAVDGTFLPAMSNVAWAVRNKNQQGTQNDRARFDVMLKVDSWLPEAIVVPEPKQGEAESIRPHIQPGNLYLYDRGYNSLRLIADHFEMKNIETPKTQAEFVIRLKGNGVTPGTLTFTTMKERKLTRQDREAGVVQDRTIWLSSENASQLGLHNIELREVVIEYEENGEIKQLRLLTNILDVTAQVIGELYRHRWQVGLFFRWIKSYGNFSHLISQTRQGMQLSLYVAIIGIMLMYLHTGFRPSKYMFSMMSLVASGSSTLDEIMPILRERERQCALARESKKLYAAKMQAKKIKQRQS